MALFPVSPNPRWRLDSNGDISAADRPIYSMFGSSMWFSGSADQITLFRVGLNSVSMWEKTIREE